MYEVRDGARTIRFRGAQLGASSSYRPGSTRWIEFRLYRTDGGTYVLHRTGVSLVFHGSTCGLVRKYGLHEAVGDDLDARAVPCEQCQPQKNDPIVYPEEYRYWTLTTENPEAVVNALYKEDENGTLYLTRVAERLLETASENDPEIDAAYRIEYIP